MQNITLGSAGITAPQNGFGALPIQRVTKEEAVKLLRTAYAGGIRYFDTARAYSDSEEKIGAAFGGKSPENECAGGQPEASDGTPYQPADGPAGQPKQPDMTSVHPELADIFHTNRSDIYLATKTHATTPDGFWKDLETSLRLLGTDYIDVYQFHQMDQCWRPGDGSGMYECMEEAKRQGKIRHIGATTHKIGVAEEIAASGLYETLQYPFSYLASDRDKALVGLCKENHVGFIAMKGLAGGLINHYDAAMAFISQYDNVMPIWGIQREKELQEWLSCMSDTPSMTDDIAAYISQEKKDLSGNFCRGCGYCMPCTVGITINQCNRMSLMLRRAPSASWLTPYWQQEMAKINDCVECRICTTRCPYELDIPNLLKKNLEDYQNVLAGKVSVS